jgi:hypothetical protein
MKNAFKIKTDTAQNWWNVNPILKNNELGYDVTNNELSIGNGATPWRSLVHVSKKYPKLRANFPPVISGGVILASDTSENLTPDSTGFYRFGFIPNEPNIGDKVRKFYCLFYQYNTGERLLTEKYTYIGGAFAGGVTIGGVSYLGGSMRAVNGKHFLCLLVQVAA